MPRSYQGPLGQPGRLCGFVCTYLSTGLYSWQGDREVSLKSGKAECE